MPYEPANARNPEQLAAMQQLAGDCWLCATHDARPGAWLYSSPEWRVAPNAWPYAATAQHLLAWPREHAENLADIRADTWAALPAVLRWAYVEHGLRDYSIAARSGDPQRTGATIRHVHFHLIVGDGTADVRMKLAVGSRHD